MAKKLGITELVLRDAHQSLLATRMRIDDMLPIAEKLDKMGFWSLETWGGATFDACIRYLGEDPWQRLRTLKRAIPNTRHQMLFRAQNILGYRHYADDVVEKFVERCAVNGMDVFRIFDAMNDLRNFKTAVNAVRAVDRHAQGAMSYTVSPVHTTDMWVDMGKSLEDMGCHSLCIKDMAGLLKPFVAEELVSRLKESCDIPIALHCHATTGLSTPTLVKAAEAGVDMVDSAISSMSQTYGHTATETIAAVFEDTDRDTGLKLTELEEISAYFRGVRKKYARFEGALQGIDSRILVAQVPGGMLTNMEGQLKEQGSADRLDEVLEEIPRVREDLGFIPLVTPTSQIVGTQAVINVMLGERYKSITKETAGVLKGEYGATLAPVNAELQARVLDGGEPITCRPADLLDPEVDRLTAELTDKARHKGMTLAKDVIDDVLIYALFPQIGLKFLENRGNPAAFEPAPTGTEPAKGAVPAATGAAASSGGPESYTVKVNGQSFDVEVAPSGAVTSISPAATGAASKSDGEVVPAPLAGNVFKVKVKPGQKVHQGDVIMIVEAMKMETEVRAPRDGTIFKVAVREGDHVALHDPLLYIS
ncbi:MAG: sodium-extruding oxaloacetate decarboxylase subunit alpha [Xanthomonadales bacterium]|jgi:oxaloacetate decarboxylase alpha subunit|nr:sodium-extruding oxaloacetate decarboxylase subunit alpha [Xanthomonadales bacterium]MDH4001080.1 sodium-extruding oxaloacetate decarboxylase subunit alpha [Xanthomonadales bacterium]